MIIYNPHDEPLLKERIEDAENLLDLIPAKYCFITGSFIYKTEYKDIDIFVITRSKKNITFKNKLRRGRNPPVCQKFKRLLKKAKITIIDFNDLYSLFYHSISKSCIAKNIIPKKPLKVTLSDYWQVINEAIPSLLNQKNKYHKEVRFLILYTEYFKTGEILDTVQLNKKINQFKDYTEIISYVKTEMPLIITKHTKPSYAKRFFYTQAGYYKELLAYKAQSFLYELTHEAVRGFAHGQP
ncbi:MAG: hypothetical protein AABW48_02565 [Nanoarchaeota archaeon]